MITRLGGGFSQCTDVESFAIPTPQPGRLLVRNHFAGINGIYDQMMCFDRIDHTNTQLPSPCGVEAIGVVEQVGEGISQFKPGDCVTTSKVGHGYTTHHVIDEDQAIHIPEVDPRYLCLNPSGISAYLALHKVGELKSGDLVCVSAAAGGLGNMLTQLAIANGNTVVAVCGSDKKARWLEGLGVSRVIRYKEESVSEVLTNEYQDRIDLGLDSVGGETFDAMLENLSPFGRLVICGFSSDRLPTEKVLDERIYTRLYWKAASVRGYMNYRFAPYFAETLARLKKMMHQESIHPLVHEPMFVGLEQVAQGVETLLAGETMGKAIVDLRTQL